MCTRRTILKTLDDDCLLDGQLHPMIRQRLERVRELPLTAVANLIGVERCDGAVCLVWEYIPGTPLAELPGDAQAWLRVAREVILAVEALHAAGITHGGIHERNVIVDPAGAVKLTHVSPLLYTDPQEDAADVAAMLERVVNSAAPQSALARMLAEARDADWPLGVLYGRLAELQRGAAPAPARDADEPRPTLRARAIIAAALVAAIGAAFVVGVIWIASQSRFAS